MRTLPTLLILSLVAATLPVVSQTWFPVDAENQYFYQRDSNSHSYVFSIRVESQSGNEMHLNKTIIPSYNLHANRLNYPTFLADWISIEEDGDKWVLHRETEKVIYPHATLGETWTYEAGSSITAQVISIEEQTLWEITDSVKTILLSTGDSIQLAKQLGVLLFPATDGKFRLKGLKRPADNLGKILIGFREIFNFEVGDQFERLFGNTTGPGNHMFERERIEILSKEQGSDYFEYGIRGIRLEFFDAGMFGYVDTFYLDTTITYYKSNYLGMEYGDFEVLATYSCNPFDAYGVVREIAPDNCENTRIKVITEPYRVYHHVPSDTSPDSLVCTTCYGEQPPSMPYLRYAEGLGLVWESFGIFRYVRLRASIKDGIQCGNFDIPDELFYSELNAEEEPVINSNTPWYYPNPVSENLTVKVRFRNAQWITIFTPLGQEVYSKKVVTTGIASLPTEHFPPGVYQIKVSSSSGKTLRNGSFVKQ